MFIRIIGAIFTVIGPSFSAGAAHSFTTDLFQEGHKEFIRIDIKSEFTKEELIQAAAKAGYDKEDAMAQIIAHKHLATHSLEHFPILNWQEALC